MKKLTALEERILLGMKIVPNMWQDADKLPPTGHEVYHWCVEHGLRAEIHDSPAYAESLVSSILRKISSDDDDAISLEDEATWILSKTFSVDELLRMTGEEIIAWLQEWKYFRGFRKREGWGECYKNNAIAALEGDLILAPGGDDVMYIRNV